MACLNACLASSHTAEEEERPWPIYLVSLGTQSRWLPSYIHSLTVPSLGENSFMLKIHIELQSLYPNHFLKQIILVTYGSGNFYFTWSQVINMHTHILIWDKLRVRVCVLFISFSVLVSTENKVEKKKR